MKGKFKIIGSTTSLNIINILHHVRDEDRCSKTYMCFSMEHALKRFFFWFWYIDSFSYLQQDELVQRILDEFQDPVRCVSVLHHTSL